MKKGIMLVCLSLMVIGGTGGTAHAYGLYPTTVSFFSDGLDLETGEVYQDPTVLAVVVGAGDEIERVLPPGSDLIDFNPWPEVDLHFEYDFQYEDVGNPFLLVPEYDMEIAFIDGLSLSDVNADAIQGIPTFQEFDAGDLIVFDPEDILVFKLTSAEIYLVMEITSYGGFNPMEVDVISVVIPEPSLLILMSLGLIGGIVIIRRKIVKFKDRKGVAATSNLISDEIG